MYQMMPQASVLLELLILAQFTLVLVHVPVDVGMGLHVALLGKLLSADVTRVDLDRLPDDRIVRMLLGLMDHEIHFLVENLITDYALHFPLDRMGSQVPHQRCLGIELALADVAPEPFDSTVQTLVHPETVGVLEGLMADFAGEHSLLVARLMAAQGTRIPEHRRTPIALERFVILVLPAVDLQVLAVLELFAAEGTDQPLVQVFGPFVRLQIATEGERFRTFVTLVPLVLFVPSPVTNERRAGGVGLSTYLTDEGLEI